MRSSLCCEHMSKVWTVFEIQSLVWSQHGSIAVVLIGIYRMSTRCREKVLANVIAISRKQS